MTTNFWNSWNKIFSFHFPPIPFHARVYYFIIYVLCAAMVDMVVYHRGGLSPVLFCVFFLLFTVLMSVYFSCLYKKKKLPLPEYNFTIAPSFYVTQMDLAGPFKAYCQHCAAAQQLLQSR